jgi:hypothetical protein
MKSSFRIVALVLLFLLVKTTFSQTTFAPYYDHLNFKGAFFVIAESDDRSNFYAVNVSQLNSDIEKKYFESLTYNDNRLIRIDGGNDSVFWFKVKKSNSISEINSLLSGLKERAFHDVKEMSSEGRKVWLDENSK